MPFGKAVVYAILIPIEIISFIARPRPYLCVCEHAGWPHPAEAVCWFAVTGITAGGIGLVVAPRFGMGIALNALNSSSQVCKPMCLPS